MTEWEKIGKIISIIIALIYGYYIYDNVLKRSKNGIFNR